MSNLNGRIRTFVNSKAKWCIKENNIKRIMYRFKTNSKRIISGVNRWIKDFRRVGKDHRMISTTRTNGAIRSQPNAIK